MNKKVKLLLQIFTTFFKIGLFTFGGGFAMIPLIEKEIVEKYCWIERDKFLDIISITQTVPGAVAINLAIFLSYSLAGILGAIVGAIGIALPSFIIIILIAVSFNQFSNNPLVQNAFMGIRPAVVALIAYAGYKLSKNISWNGTLLGFLLITLSGRIFLDINPIIIIITAVLIGLIAQIFAKKEKGQGL